MGGSSPFSRWLIRVCLVDRVDLVFLMLEHAADHVLDVPLPSRTGPIQRTGPSQLVINAVVWLARGGWGDRQDQPPPESPDEILDRAARYLT